MSKLVDLIGFDRLDGKLLPKKSRMGDKSLDFRNESIWAGSSRPWTLCGRQQPLTSYRC